MYIVITLPYFWQGEAQAITRMFEHGLERMHIRKPGSTAEQRDALLRAIPACYHDRIVIGEHLMDEVTCHACHSIAELAQYQAAIDNKQSTIQYLSLSPIFDSISKPGYKAAFTREELLKAKEDGIIRDNVLALGGISKTNIAEALSYGFGGVMVLGDAWKEYL